MKNENMVIDHSKSTENVYMLSLVDENDLAEFMDQSEKETEAEVTPAVVIPETTPAPVETEAPKQPETKVEEPEKKAPLENSNLLILGAGAIIFALLYYFKTISRAMKKRKKTMKALKWKTGFQRNMRSKHTKNQSGGINQYE